ncbi:hypothetical protein GGR57DRAFT_288373 [Xylariaceae sp. FL1272]|nr:hypothetical protein GGR57DRAFT_288373 [Xylariaceae sp. FL1272]
MGLWNAIGQVFRGPQPRGHSRSHDTSHRRSRAWPQAESQSGAPLRTRFRRQERPSGPARELGTCERGTYDPDRERIHDWAQSVYRSRHEAVQCHLAHSRAQSPSGLNYEAAEPATTVPHQEHPRIHSRSNSRRHSVSYYQSGEVPPDRHRDNRRLHSTGDPQSRDDERARSRRYSMPEQAELLPRQLRDRTRPPLSYFPPEPQRGQRHPHSGRRGSSASSHRQHDQDYEHDLYYGQPESSRQAERRQRTHARQPSSEKKPSDYSRQYSERRSQSGTRRHSHSSSHVTVHPPVHSSTHSGRSSRRRNRDNVIIVQEAPSSHSSREYGYPVPGPSSDTEGYDRRSDFLSQGTTLTGDYRASYVEESASVPRSPPTVRSQSYHQPLSSTISHPQHSLNDSPSVQGSFTQPAFSEQSYTRQLLSRDSPAYKRPYVASSHTSMPAANDPTPTRHLSRTIIAPALAPGRSNLVRPLPPVLPKEMLTAEKLGYRMIPETVEGVPTFTGTPVPESQPDSFQSPVAQAGPSVEGYDFGVYYGFEEGYGGDENNEYAGDEDYDPPSHGATW